MPESKVQEIFHVDTEMIEIHDGRKYPLAKMSWGVESKALRIAARIWKGVPGLQRIDPKNINPTELITSILPDLLEKVPDEITELVAVLLGRYQGNGKQRVADTTWIEDNLDMNDMIKVLVPFSRRFSDNMVQLIEKHLPQGAAEGETQPK
jgi:hypothetical protein